MPLAICAVAVFALIGGLATGFAPVKEAEGGEGDSAQRRRDEARKLLNGATLSTVKKDAASLREVLKAATPVEFCELSHLILTHVKTTPPEVLLALLSVERTSNEPFCSLLEMMPRLHYVFVGELTAILDGAVQAGLDRESLQRYGVLSSRVLSPLQVEGLACGMLQSSSTESRKSFVAVLTFLSAFRHGLFDAEKVKHLGPQNIGALHRLILSLHTIRDTEGIRTEVAVLLATKKFMHTGEQSFLKSVPPVTPDFKPFNIPKSAEDLFMPSSNRRLTPFLSAQALQNLTPENQQESEKQRNRT
uniref:Transmembrane protein n=1 Tax=Chromera velia CCMP2878 TaxID=1169474 RepID=A0A0G4H8Y3_9ALVE|eukprot:Cvel_25305.t1-p1 / transcript=Cvel_25305.t1 / gene=Cvel_25305 / organism=Chromera_velia_CCMP2878 / gene_product=hypothetical protein / transcript_product=hypothetical protein / location=Cvel_scaffold2847:21190-22098(-) / protein_length=303 / sequence_SO=supercontig / SO=protein_coding / is_pseudo=false